MIYIPFSLNGSWEMDYSETPYTGTEEPAFQGFAVADAVPGYWEDMKDTFRYAPFFGQLKINPEYGMQEYPIAGTAPDMALPNIIGNFYYKRSFLCQESPGSAVLFFGGVQNEASVWLNGCYLGRHSGYSTPFEMNIPNGLLRSGENTLVLSISNCALTGWEGEPVSGLTNRAACQYTGGITGDVELRVYPSPLRDAVIHVSQDCTEVTVTPVLEEEISLTWAVCDGDTLCMEGTAHGAFSFRTQELELWSPENPHLYTLELTCSEATLRRPFGIRRLSAEGTGLLFNGIPVYLRGVCEHCYYPETVHPNHNLAFYRTVVKKLKDLGFNFIRFHTHIPTEEYMQAADELGILLQVESPNYTSPEEYRQIINFCRRHTSVVIYCCGNELEMDDAYIAHMEQCAAMVHENTDALFSPMSALRGVEYFWQADVKDENVVMVPFRRHPVRQEILNGFCDLYNSYTLAQTSYSSLSAQPKELDSWSVLYNKPRLSHEICIQGTYTDLSLMDRYRESRIGHTAMFTSLKAHLQSMGLLHKAPLFFRNSSQWQRRLRKHCFEACRRCEKLAGYDYLGDIDHHWHTFGYHVGMMNEFYELKPGETVRNVRMYNGPTVLLTDLGTDFVFTAGKELSFGLYVSHFGTGDLVNARLNLRLTMGGKLLESRCITSDTVRNGTVTKLLDFAAIMPELTAPAALNLYVTLECGDTYAENEWELYLFPESHADPGELLVLENPDAEAVTTALGKGKDVLVLGNAPFVSLPTSFQISLAGRTNGNLATVVHDHPALRGMPHDGFCGWQFRRLLEGGSAVCFENQAIPFDPIIEVASSHKYPIRQSILFEFHAMKGRLLVCGFRFGDGDPAAQWLKSRLIRYARSDEFDPAHSLSEAQLDALIHGTVTKAAENANMAFNPNDKATRRKTHAN